MMIIAENKKVELKNSELDLLLVAMETAKGEFDKNEGFELYSKACTDLLKKLYAAK